MPMISKQQYVFSKSLVMFRISNFVLRISDSDGTLRLDQLMKATKFKILPIYGNIICGL